MMCPSNMMKTYRKTADGGFTVIPGVGRLRAGDTVTGDYGNLPGLEEYEPPVVAAAPAAAPAVAPEPVAVETDETGDRPESGTDEGEAGADEGEEAGEVADGAPAAPARPKRELPAAFKANQRKKKAAAAAKEGGE